MFKFIKNYSINIILFLALFVICYVIFYLVENIITSDGILQMREVEQYTSPHFPPIRCYDNLFTDKECQEIIDIAKPKLQRSTLGVKMITGNSRTSYQAWLDRNALPCLTRCSNQIAQITGIPAENQEKWQVIRYQQNQQYKAHFDACNEETDEYNDCVKNEKTKGWGKRVYTFFIYLNDVELGGETYFPLLDKGFKPKKGTAILWNNLTDDQSKSHPYSKHSGMPVKKGEKWAINVWIRQYPPR